ncbi:MAG: hypothetical protein PUG65_02115 [Firmicutes bacterium]|nr:hypothetical protein [Bacillota bacterium]
MAVKINYSIGYDIDAVGFKNRAKSGRAEQNQLWGSIVMPSTAIGYSSDAKIKIFEASKELSKDKTNYVAKFGQAMTAFCYMYGYGVEQDEKKGFKIAEKAIDHDGYGFCYYVLGEAYFYGVGTKKDVQKGEKFLSKGIVCENPFAISALAKHYYFGEEVAKDEKKAFVLFSKASEMDSDRCAFYLGEFYNKGLGGVAKNYNKAFEFYLKALDDENDCIAAREIGKMFESGAFGKPDYFTAMKYYEEETRLNFLVSTRRFLEEYKYFPFGIESNYTDSELEKLMSSDNIKDVMKVFQFITGDIKAQRQTLRVAKKLMDVNSLAETIVAIFMHDGIVVPKNEDYAMELLQHSASLGSKMAYNAMYIYLFDKDKEKAFKYLDIASGMGDGGLDVKGDGKTCYPSCLLKPYPSAVENYLWDVRKKEGGEEKAYKLADEIYAKEKGTGSKLEARLLRFIGRYYQYGIIVKKDVYKALDLYEQAIKIDEAEKGRAGAYIGAIYKNGDGVDVNYDKARDYFFAAANSGNKNSFFNLEYVLSAGDKEKSCAKTSYALLRCCVEQDKRNSSALNNYANCISEGYGTKKDEKKAFEYYKEAAQIDEEDKNFLSKSVNNYARCYINGNGVDKDVKRGLTLTKRYADEGFLACMSSLAKYYSDGEIVEKNVKEAIRIYESLLAQNYSVDDICSRLAWIYLKGNGVAKNPTKAIEYYKKGMTEGSGESSNAGLGAMYFYGDGVEKDYAKAISYFKKAIKLGSSTAYYHLGIAAMEGRGVAKDINEAKRYFKIASAAGDENAAEMLKKIGG